MIVLIENVKNILRQLSSSRDFFSRPINRAAGLVRKRKFWSPGFPVILLIALNVVLALLLSGGLRGGIFPSSTVSPGDLSGLKEMNLRQLTRHFHSLAEKRGAAYAWKSGVAAANGNLLPPGTDLHLFGHGIAKDIYREKGVRGIQLCTNDLRNACSHEIVVGVFSDGGLSRLKDIREACYEAPGGKGAYTMCFHGLGHGVLAYADYDFKEAVNICGSVGTPEYAGREAVECVGGAVMEMMAGVNDPTAWEKQKDKYLKKGDPLSPCDMDFMPDEARDICYTYLTPNLFVSAGANLSSPQPKYFKKAIGFCDSIKDVGNRRACYGGFGKEFVVLANARDIQNVSDMGATKLRLIHEWCSSSGNDAAARECTASALQSLYWGGENNFRVGIRFCENTPDSSMKEECFSQFFGAVNYYAKDVGYKKKVCEGVPESHNKKCREALGVF